MNVLRTATYTTTKRKLPGEVVQWKDTLTKPGYDAARLSRLAIPITGRGDMALTVLKGVWQKGYGQGDIL
ncbi:hypothetical protein HZ326_9601 [Fusarium oxysporum f. sp. albedinis]|jgi:hypothetical protein|nr:hypothetical protein HZ326_9601 [Fusarium oxysporum f. sp. albedinis]